MTWWKRAQPAIAPEETAPSLRQAVAELQSDVTLLYDQLERINNRLKQRASRAARDGEDRPDDVSAVGRSGDVPDFVRPTLAGESQSSSSLTASTSSVPAAPLVTKDQVRDLWRQRQVGR